MTIAQDALNFAIAARIERDGYRAKKLFDVALEETFQEADHDAAFVFRDEPLLVDAHVAAVLEHLQDRRIGRRPTDAKFFHALDEGGLGEARWRFGEMLIDGKVLALQRLALIDDG